MPDTPPDGSTDLTSASTVLKPSTGGDDARRHHEADVLRRVSGPGIVELLRVLEDPDGITLELAAVGDGRTLSEVHGLDLDEIADITAQVATATAQLHEAGVVHRAISAEHVLLDHQHRAVLCGFGEWRDISPDHPATADVMALGALTTRLIDSAVDAGRFGRDEPAAAALTQLAQLALHHPTDDGARVMADRLRSIDAPAPRTSLRDRLDLAAAGRVLGGLALGGAVVIAAVAAWSAVNPNVTASTAPPTTPAGTTPPSTLSVSTTPTDLLPATHEDDEAALLLATGQQCTEAAAWASGAPPDGWVDLTGTGCPVPWRFEDGLLTIASRDYALSDVEAVEFADCAEHHRVLLRTRSGDLFTVDELPTDEGTAMAATAVTPIEVCS